MSDPEGRNGGLSNPAFVDNEDKSGYFEDVPMDDLPSTVPATPAAAPDNADVPMMNYEPKENRRMLKNVIVTSFSFTLLFTAFQSMANLQSSINTVANLGIYTNATLYGALVVSCMFLPTYLISKFTVKWTLVFSVFGYTTFMAAQFEPMFETLIPAAIIVGLCAAPLWSAQCTYFTHIGHQYARLVNDTSDIVIVRFFGIFFLAFQSSSIWGNLISSLVLDSQDSGNRSITHCGPNFCNSENSDSIIPPSESQRYLLSAIYLGCSIAAAVVLTLFVDPLVRYGELERSGKASQLTGASLFFATFKQMKDPAQLLVIPITIWSGMEQGFFGSDFTQAYISCAWGVGKVGYVLICYGVCDAGASMCFGPIIRKVGRMPVFIFGALLNVAGIVTLFVWEPNPDQAVIFFVIAGIWGVADAIWQTQINALYGNLFTNNSEAAFSNYRLWESIGFIIAFITATELCIDVKLYLLIGILVVGMLGYIILEIRERRKPKSAIN